jgi:5-(carboxyamino)imidazole ribonucleotide synthase
MGPTIGLLGGGQLGQMLILAGLPLGLRFVVWDPDPGSPAGRLSTRHFCKPYDSKETLEEFARNSDLVTYEFENIPYPLVAELEQKVSLPQGSSLLSICQHRIREKQTLQKLSIATAPFQNVASAGALEECLKQWQTPVLLKTCMGGYDGKGQRKVDKVADAEAAFQDLQGDQRGLIAEGWLPFEREISVLVARSTKGETHCFPVVENVHEAGILASSLVPARISEELNRKALNIATKIAQGLQLHGMLAIEMFMMPDGQLLVNELAPRPHNSGHYTQDGTNVCQFEQHLRAICGWPLREPKLHSPTVMLNLLGEHIPALQVWHAGLPAEAHLHWYGKAEARPGRKMAHLNLCAASLDEALEELEKWNLRSPPKGIYT